jgi:hypothetical protein
MLLQSLLRPVLTPIMRGIFDPAQSVSAAWSPMSLWPDGIASPGMWISPRDLTSQWQDHLGTTPVATPGTVADSSNPVGLALDIRAGATVLTDPGNHMLQSTSAARPLMSARVNLLTYTEDFSNAVWTAENTTVNPTNKQSVKETATNTNHTVYYAAPILSEYSAGSKVSFQLAAKPEGQNYVTSVLLQGAGIWASVTVDLSTSTITQQLVAGGFAIESATATAGTGNLAGYTILEFVVTSSNTSSMDFPSICLSDSGTFTPVVYGRNIYMGDPLKGVRVAYAQVANGGGASYQPILTDGSSYSSTGFPIAQLYDGVDDGMATAAFSAGTLIDGMDCMIAVRRDAGGNAILCFDLGGTSGYFGLINAAAETAYNCGTPTVFVDNVQLAGGTLVMGNTLAAALPLGELHIVEFRNLDLSTWTRFGMSGFAGGGYLFNGARGDILLFPSTDSTEDKDAARQYLADYYGVTLP